MSFDDKPVMPPVIEPETFGTEHEQAPTVLWTPVAALPSNGEDPAFVLRELETGALALLLFTSLESMINGCGEGQPYVSFTVDGVRALQALLRPDVLLLDPMLAPAIRQYGQYTATGEFVPLAEGKGA